MGSRTSSVYEIVLSTLGNLEWSVSTGIFFKGIETFALTICLFRFKSSYYLVASNGHIRFRLVVRHQTALELRYYLFVSIPNLEFGDGGSHMHCSRTKKIALSRSVQIWVSWKCSVLPLQQEHEVVFSNVVTKKSEGAWNISSSTFGQYFCILCLWKRLLVPTSRSRGIYCSCAPRVRSHKLGI